MLLKLRRYLFGKLTRRIESDAIANKVWGSNFKTVIITNQLIQRNSKLLDEEAFYQSVSRLTIPTPFKNIDELFEWLDLVKALYRSFQKDTSLRSIPEDLKHVIPQQSPEEIRLRVFLQSNVIESVFEYNMRLMEDLHQLHQIYIELPEIVKQTLDRKLSNGFNCILVLNELIIEVMENGK